MGLEMSVVDGEKKLHRLGGRVNGKRTWVRKGFSCVDEAGRVLTGQMWPERVRKEEEGRFWMDADYVMVSVIGGVATAGLAVGTPAIADCTDTVVLTAVSSAGTADPLIGAARGTAAE